MGSLLLPPGSWCAHYSVCALQEWSLCFPQSCQSPAIKSCSPSKSDSLGIPPPVAGPQFGKPDVGLRTFTPVGGLLWYNCSPVCESLIQQLWDLILLWLCPSYCLIVASLYGRTTFSFVASPLSLDVGYLFWWVPVSSCHDCSAVSCDSGSLTRGSEHTCFYSTILNQIQVLLFLYSALSLSLPLEDSSWS